jgi:hypothetical protein
MNLKDLIQRLSSKHAKQQTQRKSVEQLVEGRVQPSAAKNIQNKWNQEYSEAWTPNEADYRQVNHLRDTESEWEMWTSW